MIENFLINVTESDLLLH